MKKAPMQKHGGYFAVARRESFTFSLRENEGVAAAKTAASDTPPECLIELFDSRPMSMKKSPVQKHRGFFHGDPYGNRTHVTAVKGRCLNRLTNGPGSGDLT